MNVCWDGYEPTQTGYDSTDVGYETTVGTTEYRIIDTM